MPLAGEVGVLGEDLLHVADDHVVVEEVVLHRDLDVHRGEAPHPAGDATRVVEKDSVAAGAHEEGDVLVAAWCRRSQGLEHVEIDGLPDLVELDELLAQPVDGFLGPQGEALDGDRCVVQGTPADSGVVGVPGVEVVLLRSADGADFAAFGGGDAQGKGLEADFGAQLRRRVDDPVVLLPHLARRGTCRLSHQHRGGVLRNLVALGVAHPQDRVADQIDSEASRDQCSRLGARGEFGLVASRREFRLSRRDRRSGAEQEAGLGGVDDRGRLDEAADHLPGFEKARIQLIEDGRSGHDSPCGGREGRDTGRKKYNSHTRFQDRRRFRSESARSAQPPQERDRRAPRQPESPHARRLRRDGVRHAPSRSIRQAIHPLRSPLRRLTPLHARPP